MRTAAVQRDSAILRSMTALVPIVAALLGAGAYALAGNAKLAELGRLLFAAGAIASLLALASSSIKLLPG